MLLLIQKYTKNYGSHKGFQLSQCIKAKTQNSKHNDKQRRVIKANSTVCQSKLKPIVEPRRAKPKTYLQAPTHWLKFNVEAVIKSEARTAVV